MAAFKSDLVTYTPSDPSLLRTYTDNSPESGSVLHRSFCGRCGSLVRVTRTPRAEDAVVVPMGVIDGDKADLKPTIEYFCSRKSPWIGDVDGASLFDKLP
ncbi:putative duf636 domain protein [Eutypa lata UCREL1]|uniref:Putative duf636 domain protein n=1 Tax=Eutypa lata (strain UCR-EL1) TaxID=1287681 RepID=M7SWN1_EUTLA|nr:putative duf636 domain protein [Eutypa lata UCREL1]